MRNLLITLNILLITIVLCQACAENTPIVSAVQYYSCNVSGNPNCYCSNQANGTVNSVCW